MKEIMKLYLGPEKEIGQEWVCHSFTKLPYGDNSVDELYCSYKIEGSDYKKIKSLLVELKRVLKENGILKVVASDFNSIKDSLDKVGFYDIQLIDKETIKAINKPVKIIQTSPCGTASKLLANIVCGLIKPDYAIDQGNGASDLTKDIVATHELELDILINQLSEKYKLYFIVSERKQYNKLMPPKYHHYDDVFIFQFEQLNETPNNSVSNIVDTVYNRLVDEIPFTLNKETAVKRVNDMNALYEKIKDRPFTYYDKFYCIHGHHRGRNGMDYPCPRL